MKEIYVIKGYIDHSYTATTESKIQKMVDDGIAFVNVDIITSNPDVTIHLYEERLFAFFGVPEDAGKKLVEDYLSYISSITGIDIPDFEI